MILKMKINTKKYEFTSHFRPPFNTLTTLEL